jgi:hypothetical protein
MPVPLIGPVDPIAILAWATTVTGRTGRQPDVDRLPLQLTLGEPIAPGDGHRLPREHVARPPLGGCVVAVCGASSDAVAGT